MWQDFLIQVKFSNFHWLNWFWHQRIRSLIFHHWTVFLDYFHIINEMFPQLRMRIILIHSLSYLLLLLILCLFYIIDITTTLSVYIFKLIKEEDLFLFIFFLRCLNHEFTLIYIYFYVLLENLEFNKFVFARIAQLWFITFKIH